MSLDSTCAFCGSFSNVISLKRIVRKNGKIVAACRKCRSHVYADLALGQFFNGPGRSDFKRDLTTSQYLPVPYLSFVKYTRLKQSAIEQEKYEDAKSYHEELIKIGQQFGIKDFDSLASEKQRDTLIGLVFLEDFLIAATEMGEEIAQFPILSIMRDDSVRKAKQLKSVLEKEFDTNARVWEWNQQVQAMQRQVEGTLKQIFIELKARLKEGETSWQQVNRLLPKPMPPALQAFLTDEIKDFPDDIWTI